MAWHFHSGSTGAPGRSGAQLLSSYPSARNLIPGIGYASRLPSGEYERLFKNPKYDIPKNVPAEPNLNTVKQDQETIRVKTQPEPTLQLGFGLVETEPNFEDIEKNDTELNTDSQPVNSNILSAFQHPVFNVKKEMFISGKGRKKNSNNEGVTKKGPKEHFLKIVKKKN
jgi:hypothetical protein